MNYGKFLDSLSLSHRNLLSRLTSAGSDLPPGYLYNDLVEFIKSDLSKLAEVEEYLINKLSRKEPYVKLKCLKLLKHLCIKFPKDFVRPKVTQSHLISECKSYRAPHTESNGHQLSKLVRKECEELIRVVCSYDSSVKVNEVQLEDKMVGFGNNQYSSYNTPGYNQPGGYAPGYGNPNVPNAPQPYAPYPSAGGGVYGSKGMMGFGNPNMPPPQTQNTNSLASFASNFTPTVSELKNAGNNALRMISNAANKYLPSDLVEKIEKVGSAISATASEQFEKYLGNRSTMRREPSRNLNNSMYNSSGYGSTYAPGFGYNSNPSQPGYAPSTGFGPGSYSTPGYSTVGYAGSQDFGRPQNFKTSPSFSRPQHFNPSPTNTQGFGAFPAQTAQMGSMTQTTSIGSVNPTKQPTLDLFSTGETQTKQTYSVPGEREAEFVKEMLTFTGIKVSPSPRLIEEYMNKMKEMDKGVVVDELLKQLNVRSAKWQTHFRILCILESLLLKGNLDEQTMRELKKTARPIFNKCRDEPQLASKATKLLSMISGAAPSAASDDVTDVFSSKTPELSRQTSGSASASRSNELFPDEAHDIFNTKMADTTSRMETTNRSDEKDEFDLFFSSDNVQTTTSTTTKPTMQTLSTTTAPKPDKHELFDFDSLAFDKPVVKANSQTSAAAAVPAVVSNIDNNLDLFDNTDFSAAIFEKDLVAGPGQAKPASNNFDLI